MFWITFVKRRDRKNMIDEKIIEDFKEKYKEYLECAFEEKPDTNLGDEMISDIFKILDKQTERLRSRHFSEFIILADEFERKGWTLDRFIKGMTGLVEKNKL